MYTAVISSGPFRKQYRMPSLALPRESHRNFSVSTKFAHMHIFHGK